MNLLRNGCLSIVVTGLAACTAWPESGQGGMAETRPTVLEDKRQLLKLQQTSSMYSASLQDFHSQGIEFCLPSAYLQVDEALTTAKRELHAGLINDAEAQLRYVNRQLLYLYCAFDAVRYHTACAVDSDDEMHRWQTLSQQPATAHLARPFKVSSEREDTILLKDWRHIPGLLACQNITSAVELPAVEVNPSVLLSKDGLIVEVIFDHGKSAVKDIYLLSLQRLAVYLLANPNDRLLLKSHADETGSHSFNEQLSTARAESVADILIVEGVDRSRLELHVLGETDPRQANDQPEGRSLNRRVSMTIQYATHSNNTTTKLHKNDPSQIGVYGHE